MKNKGFTIVEIVVIIVLLGLLMVLIIPNITDSSNDSKVKIYNTKINMLKKSAIMYAQDNPNMFKDNKLTITVKDLVDAGFVVAEGGSDDCKVVDPKGGCMNDYTFTIKKDGSKLTVVTNVSDDPEPANPTEPSSKTYTLTVVAGDGISTVAGDGISTVSNRGTYSVGETVKLEATKKEDATCLKYEMPTWSITTGPGTLNNTSGDSITFTVGEGDATIYVTSKSTIGTYEISYDKNNGTGTTMSNTLAHCGEPITLSPNNYSRDGYSFVGWSKDATATTATYNDQEEITLESKTALTLYAVWKESTGTFKLNLKKDGSDSALSGYTVHLSTSSSSDTSSYSAKTTSSSTLSFSSVKRGTYYVWVGKDANHKNSTVYSGIYGTISADTTTTKDLNFYTFTLNKSYTTVSINGTNLSDSVVVLGGTIVASNNYAHTIVATPSSGYTFNGWSTATGTIAIGNTTDASTTAKVSAKSTINAVSKKTSTTCTVYCTSTTSCSKTKPSNKLYGVFTCSNGRTGSISDCYYGSTKCDGGAGEFSPTEMCTRGASPAAALNYVCSSSLSTHTSVDTHGLGLSGSGYSCSCD